MELMLLVQCEPRLSGRFPGAEDVQVIRDLLRAGHKQLAIRVTSVEQVSYQTEYLIQYTDSTGGWLRAARAPTPEGAREKLRLMRLHHEQASEHQIIRPVSYRVVERKIASKVLDW